MAGYVLANAGMKVLMLEAGPYYDPAKHSQQLFWPWQSPRRGANTTRPFGDFDAAFGGWEIEGEPYTRKDGTWFDWFRSHMLGGRTNHWGRISLRFGPRDLFGTAIADITVGENITGQYKKDEAGKLNATVINIGGKSEKPPKREKAGKDGQNE